MNFREQSGHSNLRSPVCDLLCRANSSERANDRLQSGHTHLNGFSP